VGPAVIIVVLVVAIPVAVMLSGMILALVLGWTLKSDVEQRHEGSELISLNN
jgi:hypothetical protein